MTYGVGTGGGTSTDGGDTYFNATSLANAVSNGSSVSCGAQKGLSGVSRTGGSGASSAGATTFSGGSGGTGGSSVGAGGGGGSAGPSGIGKNGGSAFGTGGRGGGGSNGGASTAGSDGAGAGPGGKGNGGTGGGVAGLNGTNAGAGGNGTVGGGGGGGAANTTGGVGGSGGSQNIWTQTSDSSTAGIGGGGGAGLSTNAGVNGGAGGLYGGGGGGGGTGSSGGSGGSGSQGIIVITYTPSVASSRATLSKPPNKLGLVGYWSFDDGTGTQATDFSGRGNTGTLINSPAWVSGKHGGALNFDGLTNYVEADSIAPGLQTGSLTFSAWVKPTPFDFLQSFGNRPIIARLGDNPSGNDAELRFTSGQWEFYLCDSTCSLSTGALSAQQSKWSANQWYFITGTYSTADNTARIYVNGVLAPTTATFTRGTTPYATHFEMATFGDAPNLPAGDYLTATIDDVRIYNRALGASEIAKLYESGAVKLGASSATLTTGTPLGAGNGLVGLWTFDGADVSDKVYDRSGQGNNGYFYNGATSSAKIIGKLGQGLQFDGVDDKIALPSINLGTENSGSLWIDFRDSSDGVVIGRQGVGGGAGGYVFYVDQTDVYYSPVGGNFVHVAHGGLTSGQWNHLAVSRTGTSVTFYKNGSPLGSPQTLSSNDALSGIVSIGSYGDGTFPAQARMDDVRVYNRALSATEVKQLYLLGQATIKR